MVTALDRSRVLALRLATQRLSSAPLPTAADVVELLTCVQGQERDHAFYSLAMRSRRSTYAAVRREHDAGAFVRTHILRPTWHLVRPEDLRWILDLTSPRVLAGMAGRHRQLGLDEAGIVDAGVEQIADLVRDRRFRTRADLGAELVRLGSPIGPGERLGHLLLVAELRGVICSGPMQGVHHTYALVDEVVPPTVAKDRDEALVELVRRFFTGHGPATVRDFTRWSSLTVADTKAALAELGDDLEQVEVDGQPHWYDPEAVPRRSPAAPTAYLFPTYDEVVLTYPSVGFPAAPDHPYAERTDPFWAMVLADGENVGLWKRTVSASTVDVEVRLAPSLSRARRTSVRLAAQRLAGFLERELAYAENEGTPPLWRG
ncbi:MAG TPA: winged helix DNA-binding domain-containing protein [Pedococcus sp.]|nr:winged helix DNA-binding domain-containing protein [Pedococcus sp.]